jgi:hypothetical protein
MATSRPKGTSLLRKAWVYMLPAQAWGSLTGRNALALCLIPPQRGQRGLMSLIAVNEAVLAQFRMAVMVSAEVTEVFRPNALSSPIILKRGS